MKSSASTAPRVSLDTGVSAPERAVLRAVGREAAAAGARVYLVGGAVRDMLLSRGTKDLDVAVETREGGSGSFISALATRLSERGGFVSRSVHPRFGTATLDAKGFRLDLAATRRESYPRPASLPEVTPGATIEEDLGRRDFTIHAMAREIGEDGALGPLVDPHGGRRDLESRILRLLHERSIADDPTRACRAARYATRLGFVVAEGFGAAVELAKRERAFNALTGDRFPRAIEEAIQEPHAARAVDLFVEHGVLSEVDEEWGSRPPNAGLVGAARTDERWRALLQPLSLAARERVAERLRFSKALRRAAGISRPR